MEKDTVVTGVSNVTFKTKLENSVDLNLKPGELFIAQKPMIIKTLLGSCLSVVMHNRRTKISTISHAQLPTDKNCEQCSADCPVKCLQNAPDDNMFKYVTHSSKYMLKKLENMGIMREEIDVKLFGGANVLDMISGDTRTVGTANIEKARELVKILNLKVTAEDTGGNRGRTIYLVSHKGDVFVRMHTKDN